MVDELNVIGLHALTLIAIDVSAKLPCPKVAVLLLDSSLEVGRSVADAYWDRGVDAQDGSDCDAAMAAVLAKQTEHRMCVPGLKLSRKLATGPYFLHCFLYLAPKLREVRRLDDVLNRPRRRSGVVFEILIHVPSRPYTAIYESYGRSATADRLHELFRYAIAGPQVIFAVIYLALI